MTLSEFLDKRKKREFAATDIMCLLREHGYCFRLIDTRLPHNSGFGQKCRWGRGQKGKFIDSLKQLKIPSHFAYIKFYADKDYIEGTDTAANHIFALVSGKTSYNNLYKTDVLFSEKAKHGPAREWLSENKEKYLWYLEKILVVWSPKAEGVQDENKVKTLAESVEHDIGGLFGLFSS